MSVSERFIWIGIIGAGVGLGILLAGSVFVGLGWWHA